MQKQPNLEDEPSHSQRFIRTALMVAGVVLVLVIKLSSRPPSVAVAQTSYPAVP